MQGRTWTEIQYGVLFKEDEGFRAAGSVEYSGTRPDGTYGYFDEDICRYIAGSSPNRAVVCRRVVHSITSFDWETV